MLQLHLAALSSLKGEIIQLGSNLQHVTTEKDHLEKQLSKQQVSLPRVNDNNPANTTHSADAGLIFGSVANGGTTPFKPSRCIKTSFCIFEK